MRRILKLLNLISATNVFAAGLLGPIYATFVQGIGGDLIATGTAYSIFAVVSGALILLISRWEDRFRHKETLLAASHTLSVLGFVGYLLVHNQYQLFALELVFGIATAIENPAFDDIYSTNLTPGRFASGWGAWEAITLILVGASAFFGGIIAQSLGFQSLFIIMAAFAFLGLMTSLELVLERKRTETRQRRAHQKQGIRRHAGRKLSR